MITKVRLKNWRSHLNSEFTFSSGTNALLGSMGSGKTSCLDGICFALFGTFPSLQNRKVKLDEVIMNKPVIQDRAEVEVFFTVAEKTYSVKRIVEKGKGTTYSELRENGRLIEAPNSQRVTELVEKLLKVDFELFSKAIYSEQNALDYFLRIPRGKRMKKIDELLMIDKFESARSSIVTLINRLVDHKIGKESVLDQADIDGLQRIISELKKVLDSHEAQKSELQKKLEELVGSRISLEKKIAELKRLKEEIENLRKEERRISGAIQENKVTLRSLEASLRGADITTIEKNLNVFRKLVREYESLLSEKQSELSKRQKSLSHAKAELEVTKEKLKKLEEEFEEKTRLKKFYNKLKKDVGKIEKKLEEKKLLLEKYVGKIEAIRIKMDDLKETIDQLSFPISKCPVCNSKLTEEKRLKLLQRKKSQLNSLSKQLENTQVKKQNTQEELSKIEALVSKLSELEIELKGFEELEKELETTRNIYLVLNESFEKARKELLALEKEVEELHKKYTEVQKKKQEFELLSFKVHEYNERKDRLQELEKKLNSIKVEIERLSKMLTGVDLETMDNKLKELVASERGISTRLKGLDELMREKKARLNDFENTLATALKEKEEVSRLEKIIKELKTFEIALKETQSQLRQEFIASVNYAMSRLWPTLYPYKDFVSIRLLIENGDYVLQLQERSGNWINVEGITSGGERSLAALALRVAFALVLAPQLRILILDEPTANLDSRAIAELATTLRERITEFIDQTFLITHTPELEDAITGVGYRLERDKMTDGVTKVVRL